MQMGIDGFGHTFKCQLMPSFTQSAKSRIMQGLAGDPTHHHQNHGHEGNDRHSGVKMRTGMNKK